MSYSMSLNLQARQAHSLKQSQRLIMSPQMQQALTLLQLPHAELEAAIEQELQTNPLLEYSEELLPIEAKSETEEAATETPTDLAIENETFEVLKHLDEEIHDHFAESENWLMNRTRDQEKLQTYLESSITEQASLFEQLVDQLREVADSSEEIEVGTYVVGNLDSNGFFTGDLKELSVLSGFSVDKLQEALDLVRSLDPAGIGAESVQHSLLLQLQRLGKRRSLAYQVVDLHYEDLLRNRIPTIQAALRCQREELLEAVEKDILRLSLIPATTEIEREPQTVIPDLRLALEGETLEAVILDDRIPSLRLNKRYLQMLKESETCQETTEYIKNKIQSGTWLLKNISQRNDTLFRIGDFLCAAQEEFLKDPNGQLQPLTMKEVSEKLELHESTIARAVANKYVETPRGVLPLRQFFTNSLPSSGGDRVSSHSVKELVREIVTEEDKSSPLSDEAISRLIQEKGVKCARRTVAKYRKELQLGSASQRRKFN